jgi:hypothetical protein
VVGPMTEAIYALLKRDVELLLKVSPGKAKHNILAKEKEC